MPFLRAVISLAILLIATLGSTGARAVDAINVRLDAAAIDLTDAIERHRTEGDRIQVSTAPGADGIVRRIEVRSREGGSNWAVFALANNGDEQVDRLLVAPHYRMVGSGPTWACRASSPSRRQPATVRIGRRTRAPTSSA